MMPTTATRPKSLRFAMMLTLVLPGAGQIYLGQIACGLMYAVSFLICFVWILVVFLRGYLHYLAVSSSSDIFGENQLEQITQLFHVPVLISLSTLSAVIFVAAVGHLVWSWWRQKLAAARRKLQEPLTETTGS